MKVGIQTSRNDSPRRTKSLVYPGRTWGWCFCAHATPRNCGGRREAVLGAISVSTFVAPKNVTRPAMRCTSANIFQTGQSSSATSLLQRPAPPLGAYILMNLSNSKYPISTIVSLVLPGSPWLNQSHPSETTVLVTHASWQRQSQTCICYRVPFTPT